jgi:hypothetical protein
MLLSPEAQNHSPSPRGRIPKLSLIVGVILPSSQSSYLAILEQSQASERELYPKIQLHLLERNLAASIKNKYIHTPFHL